ARPTTPLQARGGPRRLGPPYRVERSEAHHASPGSWWASKTRPTLLPPLFRVLPCVPWFPLFSPDARVQRRDVALGVDVGEEAQVLLRRLGPGGVLVADGLPGRGEVETAVDRRRPARQERLEQDRRRPQRLGQVEQHLLRRLLVGLDQLPRLLGVGVLVGRRQDALPDELKRLVVPARLDVPLDLLDQ